MDDKPKRRWFRFRLSTILILIAIVAWTMAIFHRRDMVLVVTSLSGQRIDIGTIQGAWLTSYRAAYEWFGSQEAFEDWIDHHRQYAAFGWAHEWEYRLVISPRLLGPALALAVFLAWKTAWALGPRIVRRRQSVAA